MPYMQPRRDSLAIKVMAWGVKMGREKIHGCAA